MKVYEFVAVLVTLLSASHALPSEFRPSGEHRCHGHGKAHTIGEDFPQVQSLEITKDSVDRHHTQKYRSSYGFGVRRGLPFDLNVATNIKLSDDHGFLIGFDEAIGTSVPHFNATITGGPTEAEGSFVYRVQCVSRADDPVGRWQSMAVMVISRMAQEKGRTKEGLVYQYPFPVFVLPREDEPDTAAPEPDLPTDTESIYGMISQKEEEVEGMKSDMEKWADGITTPY